jgi:hypothetical protein
MYLFRETAEKILYVMNHLPDHDAFYMEVDNSSAIGSKVTLEVDIIHNELPGRFRVEVQGTENW